MSVSRIVLESAARRLTAWWRDGTNGRELNATPEHTERIRVEVAGLFADPPLATRLERDLSAVPGVTGAHASPRTGRVLITFADPAARRGALAVVEAHARRGTPPPPLGRHGLRARGSLRRRASGSRGHASALPGHGARPRARGALPRLAERARSLARRVFAMRHDSSAEGAGGRAVRAFHAEDAAAVARSLGTDVAAGLGSSEARDILRRAGPNVLAGVETRSQLAILAGQVFTVPTALLASAAALSLLLGDVIEAGAILVVVGSNAAIGYITESRAEELLHAWGDLRVEWARVIRDGRERALAASELVPGDMLVLRAGEPVAADARVVEASALTVDESMLTGESEPVEKSPAAVASEAPLAERHSMVYAGTVVASGHGAAVVVATGASTELGNIQRALSRAEDRAPPIEQELSALGRRLAGFALGSAVAVVGIGVLRRAPLRASLRGAVALGVAAIPEGFPAVGTTALSLASRKLRAQGIVIRRLAAAETLGAVSVICADKTGTLTENRMRVAEIFLPGEGSLRVVPHRDQRGVSLVGEDDREIERARVHELARIAALNADVELSESGKILQGSGTERALVEFALAAGYPVSARRRTALRVGEERRSAERAFMVTVHEHPELGDIELVKGAPEQVVALCAAPLPELTEVLRQNAAMASRGLRVLALAWRKNGRVDNDAPLLLAGIVGLRDPPRADVKEALATLSRAGIRTLMLTGDQERTARAIGAELGIAPGAVYSRVTPEAKLDIVRDLQRRGEIVAMTGDGVNDGPALKAADVGIAMGRRGTDIARAVADVVLAQDDLPSLTEAVGEGRRLHDNVRRAIAYFVATNTSEVLMMLSGALAGASPLTPLQLLWINLLTDVAPALALALEPSERGTMERPPRNPLDPLFRPVDLRDLAVDAASMAGAGLGAYVVGAARRGSARSAAGTMAFTSLVTAQLMHIFACRARAAPGDDNPYVGRALAATGTLQALALCAAPLRRLLATERLVAAELAVALVLGAMPSLLRGPAWLRRASDREIVVAQAARSAGAGPSLRAASNEETALQGSSSTGGVRGACPRHLKGDRPS